MACSARTIGLAWYGPSCRYDLAHNAGARAEAWCAFRDSPSRSRSSCTLMSGLPAIMPDLSSHLPADFERQAFCRLGRQHSDHNM
jgi:hypothetical protein